ncbi:tissue factor pathway inhibitor a [Chanos chanos]|uniref:Tissue factor pathway inhibitor n=1 Tax=Chanos chanos TaxID=29144 RepID=A0A6J2WH71_CHACN|nr:tissue factor pathway inhibitor-like [Chanos chanos]
MASRLSWARVVLLFLVHTGTCTSSLIRDEVRSELSIFHHSCALKKEEGPCKAVLDRFFFDTETGRCQWFEYGGCQGNANNFKTMEECEEACVVTGDKSPCHLPDEPGPCRGLVPRFYFDSQTQECKRFFYGGCFGNANNFRTIKECQDKCQRGNDRVEAKAEFAEPENPRTESLVTADEVTVNESYVPPAIQPESDITPPEFCLSPVQKGHCDGAERRYAYSPKTKRCQLFRYSGCGGNKNNFVLKRHCMKMCTKDHNRKKQIRIKKKSTAILFRSV